MKIKLLVALGVVALSLSVIRSRVPSSASPAPYPVYAVPEHDTAALRVATDTLFAQLGVEVDSVVWAADSLLYVHLKRGTFMRTIGSARSLCATGADPFPATQYVAVRMYEHFARERAPLRGIVVHAHDDSAVETTRLGREGCTTSHQAYFYRSTLDSLVGRDHPTS